MGCRVLVPLLLFVQILMAKNVALFWGGGGEPASRETTIFDSDFRAFVPGLIAKGWQVRPLFGRGHTKTEELVKLNIENYKNREFTSENVIEEIQKLRAEISSLSRVLLIVSSHGLPPVEDLKAHQVMATDPRQQQTVDLNLVSDLQQALEKQKVPFAIIDLGCYSGATLDFATDNTCVISSSSSQEFSYSEFAQALAMELFKGSHFESSFLKARQQFDDFSAPEISTPENSVIKFQLAQRGFNQFPHKTDSFCSSCEIHSRLLKFYKLELGAGMSLTTDEQLDYFLQQIQKSRDEAQQALRLYDQSLISFDEREAVKSKSLILHFFNERQLYHRWYEKIQSQDSHPCRFWKL
jgi:hypothetical protein